MRAARSSWIMLCGLLSSVPAARAEEPQQAEQQNQQWQDYYQREAAGYRFILQAKQPEELQLRAEPVMRWVSLNDFNGNVFIWTREGRPEIVGTIFSFPRGEDGTRSIMHEFHSLSAGAVEATGADGRAWSFSTGAMLKPIPDAPAPAPLAAQRLLQARSLARQFSAHMQRQGERWQLRLLSQPVYTYSEPSDETLGGAVFALVGYITDPEILLLIEARQTAEGPQWFYAPARFSDKTLSLQHKDAEVWQFVQNTPTDEPYYLAPGKTIALDASK